MKGTMWFKKEGARKNIGMANLRKNIESLGRLYLFLSVAGAIGIFAFVSMSYEDTIIGIVLGCIYFLMELPLSFILLGIGKILKNQEE